MESDKKIQELLNSNPEKGIEILLSSYGGIVRTICKNLLSGFSNEDIDDTIADCFIAFWKSRKGIIKAVSVKGYLIGITKKTVYSKLKDNLKIPFQEQIDDMDLGADIDIFNEVSRNINYEIINNVVASIPEFEREIFIRRYYYCEKVKSIADSLNCNEKKVENILYRYKNQLRIKLLEGGIIL